MISCPACGAGMRFDIPTQQLKCDYCDNQMAIDDARIGSDAHKEEMDLTLFTCPQCGGEIYSGDNEAASFCTFCGSSVMLEGRLTSTKKPAHIIPFKKTKEDCKKLYGDLTKGMIFAPKELKDPEYLDRFRAIYLPFWDYSVAQKGPVLLKGTRESGNYTEHLNLTCELDATFDGIAYDASSAFTDDLCSYITPFNQKSLVDFNPAYMSGFYADTADVDSKIYVPDALEDANRETFRKMKGQFRGASLNTPDNMTSAFHTELTGISAAMYPVWFLTYRSGDRVAYAVVNGETGKIAADLPVDRKKFLLGSLLLAIPVFLLLTLFPVITARVQLIISVILAVGTFIIFLISNSEIKKRETRSDDKGYQSVHKGAGKKETHTVGGGFAFMNFIRSALCLVSAVIGLGIILLKPVSDVFYYGGSLIVFVCTAITLFGLIGHFNLLTTRPIPEFHNRGGEDHV